MSDRPETSAEPGAAPTEAQLRAFSAQAENLDEIKRSVNDASSVSGGLWISYLFVLFYLAIAAGAVTPVDLFMENPVKLPFLSIELPLKAFFFLAPILFLVCHIYTLVAFVILSDKAKWYHRELRRQLAPAGTADGGGARDVENDLRRQLVSNIFVQFLAGPTDLRQGPFGLVLKLIVWTTLVFAPAVLLLLLQIQFLPFHDHLITWVNRIILLADLAAVWWLWGRILKGRFSEAQIWRRRWSLTGQGAGIVLGGLAIAFSWCIATFPGEWQETALPSAALIPVGADHMRVSLHDFFFNGKVDATTRRRSRFFTSTLILPVFDIYEQLKIDDPSRVASRLSVFNARGRDLRGAVFDLSTLSQVDFEGAHLEGASFDFATLRTTSFYCAHMRRASFYLAKFEGAWFHAADLSDAPMQSANGQAARFEGAVLTGAQLEHTNLRAATLDGADLRGAKLTDSSLKGASLTAADVEGDCVTPERHETAARGATLANTDLAEADLEEASLRGANLADVLSLRGAKLGSADLSGATLSEAKLVGIDERSSLRGIRLDDLKWQSEDTARSVATDGAAPPSGSPRETLLAQAARPAPYAKGLTQGLTELVCSGEASSSFVVRGLIWNKRIEKIGDGTPGLVDAMLTGTCASDLALSGEVKTELVAFKLAALRREAR